MTTYQTILIAYAFLGCVYWLWLLVGAVRIVRAVPVLAERRVPEPAVWPRVSIVVAACDEIEAIEGAARTLLAQNYPRLEVVLVDDRSTDGTGQIIDRIAAADRRVRAVHVEHLPKGWLGKVHALATGCDRARGDWLLFTDADVFLAPGAVRRAIAYCEHRRVDHLAVMPEIWRSGMLVDAVVGVFLRIFPVGTRCWAVENPRSGAFIGVGAFNLVRRAAFQRTEGFAWLRLEVADDMGLGLMLKRARAHCGLANGRGLVGLYWYRSMVEIACGMEKGYASVSGCRPLRGVAVAVTFLGLEWAPLAMLLPLGVPGLWQAGVVMLTAAAANTVIARRRILPTLLWPLAATLGAALLLRTVWLGWRRGGIVWRGTFYPSSSLRSGCRVRFP